MDNICGKLLSGDWIAYIGLNIVDFGVLVQVCREFRDNFVLTATPAGSGYILKILGAEVARVYGTCGSMILDYHTDRRGGYKLRALYYTVGDGYTPELHALAAAEPTTVAWIRNTAVVGSDEPILKILATCGIKYELLTVAGIENPGIASRYDLAGNSVYAVVQHYSYYHPDRDIIMTNCRYGKIVIGQKLITCGPIWLLRGENYGPYRYLLGVDVFSTCWPPEKIAAGNSMLAAILLQVV